MCWSGRLQEIADKWFASTNLPAPPRAIFLLQQLQRVNAPLVLMRIVFLLAAGTDLDFEPKSDSLETFAGKGEFTTAKRQMGLTAIRYEIQDDCMFENILTDWGFLTLIYMALTLKDGVAPLLKVL